MVDIYNKVNVDSVVLNKNIKLKVMLMKKSFITDQLGMDFEKSVYEIKKNGFRYIEIHSLWGKTVENLNYDEIKRVKKIISKYDIEISCLSTTLFLMCPLYTDVDNLEKFSTEFLVYEGNYNKHVDCLKKCIEFSQILNANYLRIFPFRKEKGIDKEYTTIISDISEKLYKPAKIARDKDKILIVENCPHTYLPRGLMTYELVKKINQESLKLLWDVGNSFKALRLDLPDNYISNVFEEYGIIKSRIGYCHFKDYKKDGELYTHSTFGEGSIDFMKLLMMLKDDNYSRFISLEPEVSYSEAIQSIKNLNKQYKEI